jgi:putative ABC transport system ATP-binding protein
VLLEAERVSKTYKRDGAVFSAVSDASLRVGDGELVCVTGRSGSGKSTLLGIVAGLLPPTEGHVIFDGADITKLRDSRLSRLRGPQIGYIPQGHSLLASLSVIDNVRLPLYLGSRAARAGTGAAALLDKVGAGHLAAQYPAQLSGGELRRVSIARALLREPRLLIADEPTGDLDPDNAAAIFGLFEDIAREGAAILLVTHDPALVERCDRRYDMSGGELRASDVRSRQSGGVIC